MKASEELCSEDEFSSRKGDGVQTVGSVDDTEETYAESVDVAGGMSNKKHIDPELECPICIKLLFRPVSTSCGHTFCQLCLEEALEHRPLCPLCRESINREASCHENRLVQSLIAKQYPVETRRREREIENATVTNDALARSRRRDMTTTFLKKHKTVSQAPELDIKNDPSSDTCRDGLPDSQVQPQDNATHSSSEPAWKPEEVPVIFQSYKYELPFPSDYVELYFEAPMYLDMVADVIRNVYPGFVIVLEQYQSRRRRGGPDTPTPPDEESNRATSVESRDQSGPIAADYPSSDDMELPTSSLDDDVNTVGVMIEIQQCLTFNHQMRLRSGADSNPPNTDSDQEHDSPPVIEDQPVLLQTSNLLRARSTLQSLFTSVRSPPPSPQHGRVASWVPRRLYQHRLKIRGNRRDMWRQQPESNLFPEGCCIVRGECLFRTIVDKSVLQYTRKGYSVAPVTPLFDAPLFYGSGSNLMNLSSHTLAESLTRSLSLKLNSHLMSVCPAGKLLFQRKFGPMPPLVPRPTSVNLECWSLWATKVVQMSAKRKAYFMSLNDTVDRLRKINHLLDGCRKQHLLALGLSSAGTESLSWMLSTGSCGSFVLGVIIFVFLVAGSFWHRFGWDGKSGEWPFYSV